MVGRVLPVWLPFVLVCAGCAALSDNDWRKQFPELAQTTTSPTVPENPFGHPKAAPPPTRVGHAPASKEAATRVAAVGQKVLAANPKTGLQPVFLTIGAPQPEILHQDTSVIYVTEGLVKACPTDGQLAALVCHELGKMVAEREAVAGAAARGAEREPPINMPVGRDSGGPLGAADFTHLAELGKYERERRRSSALPPDPQVLARAYFANTGFPNGEFEAAAPVLRAARENSAFEKQFTGAAPGRTEGARSGER